MLKFYLNNHEINVETNSCFISTLNKTLDTGTLVLEWNSIGNAIFPKTKLKIVDTELNDEWNFIVLQDQVSVVKKTNPVVYSHSLTVQQDISEMSDHLVRNSIFQQPEVVKDTYTLAIGYVNVRKYTDSPHFRIIDHKVHMPFKSYTPDTITYRRQRRFISPDEKIASIEIEVESTATAYTELQTTTQINLVHPNNIVKNCHLNTPMRLNFYRNENDVSPEYSYEFSVKRGTTKVVIPFSELTEAESGWYDISFYNDEIQIDDSKFESTDLAFVYNGGTIQEEEDYPTIIFSFKATAHYNTYYYSLWDVLDILKKQTEKNVNNVKRVDSPYLMPSKVSSAGEVLALTVAPEFTFTGKDLYTCVAEVMSYLDSIPMLNSNGEIVFEQLNNNKNDLESNVTFADISTSLTNESFVNRLVTNYQNGKQETLTSCPGSNIFRKATSNGFGVPTSDSYIMKLNYPIDSIKHCYISIANCRKLEVELAVRITIPLHGEFTTLSFDSWNYYGDKIDIGNALVEENYYNNVLESIDVISTTLNKLNALPYTRGATEINFGGKRKDSSNIEYTSYKLAVAYCILNELPLGSAITIGYTNLYDDLPTLENVLYNVEYYGVYNGQSSIESREPKYNGEQYVGQSGSNVSLTRMGANMAGLIARLGNEVKNVVMPVTSYGSRIKKGSRWEDSDGNIWRVNRVKTTFSTSSDSVIVEAEMSKNFNINSDYSNIDRNYRLFEVDESIITKGFDNINEIIYLGFESHNDKAQSIAITDASITSMFNQTLKEDNGSVAVKFATIKTESYNLANTLETMITDMPIHTYGLGNTICLEMGLEHPTMNNTYIGSEQYFLTTRLVCKPDLYTNGKSDTITLAIYSGTSLSVNNDFPKTSAAYTSSFTKIVNIDYDYYKRQSEIVHVNYGISFLPYPNHITDNLGFVRTTTDKIFIGESFVNKNALIQNNGQIGISKDLHLYTSSTMLYSVMDRKVLSFSNDKGIATISVDNATRRIRISVSSTINCISWALADTDGNIYIAANQEHDGSSYIDLYWTPRQTRI